MARTFESVLQETGLPADLFANGENPVTYGHPPPALARTQMPIQRVTESVRPVSAANFATAFRRATATLAENQKTQGLDRTYSAYSRNSRLRTECSGVLTLGD